MKRTTIMLFSSVLIICLSFVWGCPKKTEVMSRPETASAAPQTGAETQKNGEGISASREGNAAAASSERAGIAAEGLQPVYFDYDRSVLREDAKRALQTDAKWLKAHPAIKVRIEGNCDERGTIEYNQVLGQRRAEIARKYLADMGISADHITVISYGKEKPLCSAPSEVCWQKNRRDDVVGAN